MSDTQRPALLRSLLLYIEIALLRRGPEDAPASVGHLLSMVAAYAGISLLVAGFLPDASSDPFGLLAVSIAVSLLWYWVVLRLARKPGRYLQTASAIFGVQFVLAPLGGLLQWFLAGQVLTPEAMSPGAALAVVALAVWTVAIVARILRSATEWPTTSCVALVLAHSALEALLVLALLPDKVAP